MTADRIEQALFCTAFLCDSVKSGPDGAVRDILGIGPDVAITTSLPLTMGRTIVAMCVGPVGQHELACVLTKPDGEQEYMGRLTVKMGGPPDDFTGREVAIGRGYTTAPFNVIFHDEGLHFLEFVLDHQYLVHRLPILVRVENLAGSVH